MLAFIGVFIAGAICGGPFVGRLLQPHRPALPQMMEHLGRELNLSEEQKEKIRPLMLQAQQETQRLRRENVKAITEVMDRTHAAIAAELTPEQRIKQDEMRKRFRERSERLRAGFREHGPRGD